MEEEEPISPIRTPPTDKCISHNHKVQNKNIKIKLHMCKTAECKALCELKLHTEIGNVFQNDYIHTKKENLYICINYRGFSHECFRMRYGVV